MAVRVIVECPELIVVGEGRGQTIQIVDTAHAASKSDQPDALRLVYPESS